MRRLLALALLAPLAIGGCSNPAAPTTPMTSKVAVEGHDEDDHDHARGKMMIAHLGKYHAGLTAHISAKDGNELDIFVETVAKSPEPVALPLPTLTAKARREGDEREYDLTFEPAPASERPKGEPPGSYSHYVAKAPFLKADDNLTVVVEVELDGRKRKCTWRGFDVKKFTHHAD